MNKEIKHFTSLLKAGMVQADIYDAIGGYDPRNTNAVHRVEKAVTKMLQNMSLHDSLTGKFILADADDVVDHKLKSNTIKGADLIRLDMAVADFVKVAGAMNVNTFGHTVTNNVGELDGLNDVIVHENDNYRIYFQL